jgi:hypothetical protein
MACEHLQNKTCLILKELGIGSDNYQVACDNICKGEPDNLRQYFGNNKQSKEEQQRRQEAEAERQRMLAEMPGGFELAANLWRHLKEIHAHYKATGRIKLEQADIERRILICQDCPSKRSVIDDKGHLRCTDCGCHIKEGVPLLGLDGKAAYEAIDCKRGHWPEINL